jgi:hypothetical protein
MKTLFEIVEDVKDGKKPEYEEIRCALLVYCFMFNLEYRQYREVLSKDKLPNKFIKDLKIQTSFDMYKKALKKAPDEFLGKDHPDNPEYQKFRKLGNKLFDKVAKE